MTSLSQRFRPSRTLGVARHIPYAMPAIQKRPNNRNDQHSKQQKSQMPSQCMSGACLHATGRGSSVQLGGNICTEACKEQHIQLRSGAEHTNKLKSLTNFCLWLHRMTSTCLALPLIFSMFQSHLHIFHCFWPQIFCDFSISSASTARLGPFIPRQKLNLATWSCGEKLGQISSNAIGSINVSCGSLNKLNRVHHGKSLLDSTPRFEMNAVCSPIHSEDFWCHL